MVGRLTPMGSMAVAVAAFSEHTALFQLMGNKQQPRWQMAYPLARSKWQSVM